jgi:rare lipoprotein A
MRPKARWRRTRSVQVTMATTMLAVPASAVALTTVGEPEMQADAQTPLKIDAEPHHLGFGDDVTVTGAAPAADQGATLLLETAPTRGAGWRSLTSTRVGRGGRFVLRAPLQSSGLLKVLDADAAAGAHVAGAIAAHGAAIVPASAPQPVSVAAQLRFTRGSVDLLAGQRMDLRGRMLPSAPGRQVRLQGRSGHAWRTLATTRTGGHGGFDLHYRPAAAGRQSLRVLFAGDQGNARASRAAGELNVYEHRVASWYDDAGSTACGFHANFGVANRDLPCGTRVSFRYGGRSVTAVVDDRGPYVGGRDWDLNQNTAAALGFAGVGTVWSTR